MDNRIAFGILTLTLNSCGVPCFIQGKAGTGVKRIIFGVISCGVIGVINMVKGIILGIEILNMSDEEYAARKGTFDSGIPA